MLYRGQYMYIHIFIVTDNNKFCILTSPLYTCFSTKSSVQYTLECKMTLCGIKVIELAGLAPGPFCGMVLSDFGASVIRIDKIVEDISYDCLGNGKQSLAVNLKHEKGVEIFKKLCITSDIVLDTYRAGVMESLGIGPNVLLKENPRLIYARLSGFGQYGRLANRPGHDMNFLALTERVSSGKGQIVDCNMVEGTAYLASWIYRSQNMPFWGHKDGKYLKVLDCLKNNVHNLEMLMKLRRFLLKGFWRKPSRSGMKYLLTQMLVLHLYCHSSKPLNIHIT
ncbi:Alpha-methylacyl-CoA racemase [Carabus blaptoides fortunei]